jgi:tetratricopeptide (TPR) repeat protein
MRWKAIAAVSILTFGLNPAVRVRTRDDNWALCSNRNTDLAIQGCTAIIQSGHETGRDLASAYDRRGIAYGLKKQPDRAI